MTKINILMPSCQDPLETSDFILGGRLLEYLQKVENGSNDAFFFLEDDYEGTSIFISREKSKDNPNESLFFIYSNDSFCDNIQNSFFIENTTVEKLGQLVKDMYKIISEQISS